MASELTSWCKQNIPLCVVAGLLVLHVMGVIDLQQMFNSLLQCFGLEGLDGDILAAEPAGKNEDQQSVTGLGRTPSTCYPQQKLKPEDLLPNDENKAIQEFNISKPVGEGILQGVNMLDSSYHVGVNTIGQSLRNANRQLRSEPPNPQVNVSPWMNTTIGPDLPRRPLEVGESCPE